jgi:hypothetical protein
MALWPEIREGDWLQDILGDHMAVRYWKDVFDEVFRGEVDSWAYRWLFSCWTQSALTVLPNVNLVQNVGFGTDATHTADDHKHSHPAGSLDFPLTHPPFVCRDARADDWTQEHVIGFRGATVTDRIRRCLRRL